MDKDKVTIRDVYEQIAKLRTEVNENIDTLRDEIKNMYTLKAEFEPVRMVVYGLVGLILTSVIGAVIYLVLQK